MGDQTHGEDHQIEFFGLDAVGFVHIGDFQVFGAGVLGHPGDHGPDVADAVNLPGPLVIAVKTLALGPQVQEKDGGFHPGVVFPGDHGLLGGLHAADRGAVFPADAGIPGADALNPGDFLGFGVIAGAFDLTAAGPGGGQEALEFQGIEDIGIPLITVFRLLQGVEGPEPRGQNDGPHLHFPILVRLGEIHRLRRAQFLTGPAGAFIEIDAMDLVDGVF